jgi:hypothetical protein
MHSAGLWKLTKQKLINCLCRLTHQLWIPDIFVDQGTQNIYASSNSCTKSKLQAFLYFISVKITSICFLLLSISQIRFEPVFDQAIDLRRPKIHSIPASLRLYRDGTLRYSLR